MLFFPIFTSQNIWASQHKYTTEGVYIYFTYLFFGVCVCFCTTITKIYTPEFRTSQQGPFFYILGVSKVEV